MRKIAVISAILENPGATQQAFNDTVSQFSHIVRGRLGLPFERERVAAIALTVCGSLDEINALTGRLGRLPGTQIKTAISKLDMDETETQRYMEER